MSTCRICLEPDDCRDISEMEIEVEECTKTYFDMIIYCLDIKIDRNSSITTELCQKCCNKIISFYCFKTMALRNDDYLKSIESIQHAVMNECDNYGVIVDCIKKEEIDYFYEPVKAEPEAISIEYSSNTKENIQSESGVLSDIKKDKNYDSTDALTYQYFEVDAYKKSDSTEYVECSFINKEEPSGIDKDIKYDEPTDFIYEYLEPSDNESSKSVNAKFNLKDKHKKSIIKGDNKNVDCTPDFKEVQKQGKVRKTCDICGKSFQNLNRHVTNVHKFFKKPQKLLQCKFCDLIFVDKKKRRKHTVVVHYNEEKYCKICNKEFKYLKAHHQTMHTPGSLKYICDLCGRKCSSYSMMLRHKDTHETNPAFQCDHCNKFFRSKLLISLHIRRIHMQEKSYQCEICAKAFFKKYHLDMHLKSHDKRNALKCPLCGKEFARLSVLTNHWKMHKDRLNIENCLVCKKYLEPGCILCKDCDTIFQSKKIEKKEIHCKLCNKTYSVSGYWKHQKVKHLNKRERCNICDKDIVCLKEHLTRVHFKNMPFACETCDKRFDRPSALKVHEMKMHMRTAHNKKKTLN